MKLRESICNGRLKINKYSCNDILNNVNYESDGDQVEMKFPEPQTQE